MKPDLLSPSEGILAPMKNLEDLQTLSFGGAFLKTITENHNVTYFKVEENFVPEVSIVWFRNNFASTYYAIALYLVVIFGGRHLMKTREKFDLRGLLVMWNFGLALFSIVGFVRVFPELLNVLFNQPDGFYHSVCTTGYLENKVMSFWVAMFSYSKLVELGDTAFIVLRKQPLIFLHWYHHVSVLVFTWYTGTEYSSLGRWYTSMNLFVHSLMYTYYGLKALRFSIPKPIAQAITSLQLLQMITGVTVTVAAWMYKSNGLACETKDKNIMFSLSIYFSYWVLFANFFYHAYLAKGSKTGAESKKEKKSQ